MSRVNKTFFLPALLLTVLLASCVDIDDTMGSAYVPLDKHIILKQADFDLPVGMKYPDSLNTELYDLLPVGSISSEEYGNVTVGAAVSIVPTCLFKTWGENPVFKEMTMTLPMASIQALDGTQKYIPQNIYVHRMKCELDSTMVYSNSIEAKDYTAEQCCTGINFTTGLDTVRIHFSEEFARPLFSMDSMTLDSVQLFCKAFKGLYIRTDKRKSSEIGGRISEFNVSGNTCIDLVYTSTRKDGYRRDTVESFGVIASDATSIMTIDRDYLTEEKSDAASGIMTDGLAGITPYINGRELRDRLDKWIEANNIDRNDFLVSKAVLEFPVNYSGRYADYNIYPTNLYPCRRLRDSSGRILYTPINEIYTTEYNDGTLIRNVDDGSNLYYYRPDAALYLQMLVREDYDKVDDSYDIWLMPTGTYTFTTSRKGNALNDYYSYYYYSYYGIDINSSSQTIYAVDNSTYHQGKLNGTASIHRPKLRLTYSVTQNTR